MESNFTFSKDDDKSVVSPSIATIFALSFGATMFFVVPTSIQIGGASILGLLFLFGLTTAVSYADQRFAFQIPARWGNAPMLFGIMIWTTGWVVAAVSRGVAGHMPIMLGLLLFGLGMLLMSWNLSDSLIWKATLVIGLGPGLLQLFAPGIVGTLTAGTQFYLMFLYSIGWVLMAIQQKI